MSIKLTKSRCTSILILILTFFFSNILYSQNHIDEPCGFTSLLNEKLDDPNFLNQYRQHNLLIKEYLKKPKEKSGTTIIIPIVVHVLHKGEDVGVGSNISDAQIISSIDNLNDVYSNTANGGVSVDMGVQFVLAKRDPNCNSTNGIVRVDASSVPGYTQYGVNRSNSNGADDEELKDLSKWPTDKYMNFWIVSEIDGNDGQAGVQGYANLPVGIDEYNGAVMMSTVFGYDPNGTSFSSTMSSNKDNSTVTHEVGHFLDLYHPFEGGDTGVCPPNESDCSAEGDFICDTPPIMNYLNYDNNTIYFNCPNGVNNACSSGTLDQVMHNIMNYTSCPDRFTAGQRDRVLACLATSRASLTSSLGAVAPSGTFTTPISSCNSITSGLGLNGGYGGIIDVKLNGVINSSSSTNIDNSTDGYMDFSTSCLSVINLEENENYDLNVSTWYNTHYVKAWIDYNNDGDFDDVGEEITQSGGLLSTNGAEVTQNFTIPPNATLNTYLRMRVKAEVQNNSFSSCSGLTYGQAEDFTVFISSLCNNSIAEVGQDTLICSSSSYTTSATASEGVILWSTSGDGTFNNPSIENPTYSPGANDISNGEVTLTLDVTNTNGCSDASDDLVITITGIPSSNTGSDQTICSTSDVLLNGSASNGTIKWTSSGNGSFDNDNLENVNYTPSIDDINNGTVSLTMTVSSGGCSDAIDVSLINIEPEPTADIVLSQDIICENDNYTLSASVDNGIILWTTSGDGTFDDVTVENPVYSPGNNDIINETVDLTLEVSNSFCTSANDILSLSINLFPTSNITLSEDEICEDQTYLLNAVSLNGNSNWVTSGDGSFNDSSIENATYIPGVNDKISGSVNLTLNVSNESCSSVSDNISITLNSLPNVDAGSDQNICFGTNTSLIGSGAVSYSWNNGVVDGVDFSPSSGSTVYSLTGTDINGCVNYDNVTINVFESPFSDAGADRSICSNSNIVIDGISSNGTILWSTSGTGSFMDVSSEDVTYLPSLQDVNLGTVILTMTVSNNFCANSVDDVEITINTVPQVSLNTFEDLCVYSSSITLTGGIPLGGIYKVDNVISSIFNPSIYGTGTYTVSYEYIDLNNCSGNESQTFSVGQCASIGESTNNDIVQVFPNPSFGGFKVLTNFNDYSIEITDINGKIIKVIRNQSKESEVQLLNIKSGIYFVNIINDNNIIRNKISVIE